MSDKVDNIWFPETDIEAELLKETKLKENGLSESFLWKNRPSRLSIYNNSDSRKIKCSEQNRLTESLRVNYYRYDDLKLLIPNTKQLETLIEDKSDLKREIVFPAVNKLYSEYKEKNIITPLVSYSSFVDIVSFQKYVDENKKIYIETSKRLNQILKDHFNINFTSILIPELAFFVNEIDGDSYNLAYILSIWLDIHPDLYKNVRFFCTGEVDDSGNIIPISDELEKFEAAINSNFTYVIFPIGNKKIIEENFKKELDEDLSQALNTGSKKYLFFSTVFELYNWLLENAEPDKSKVMIWASTNRKEPNPILLKNYLKKDYNNYELALNKITQSLINSDEKIKKIDYLTTVYLDYLDLEADIKAKSDEKDSNNDIKNSERNKIIFSKLKSFLPKDILYYCYLYFFMSPNNSELIEGTDFSINLYIDISSALTETNVDLSLACKRFNKLSDSFRNGIFNKIKKRYYKLLCLLFRNPIELLCLLSLNDKINDDRNSIAYKMLSILIEESKKDKYQEDYLMNKIFEVFSQDICILNYDSLTIAKILTNLISAKINFRKNNNVEGCLTCDRYYKLIIDSLDKPIEDKEFLFQVYNNNCKLTEDEIYENIKRLKLQEFYNTLKNNQTNNKKAHYSKEIEKYIYNINYLLDFYKNGNKIFSKMPVSQNGYFPQFALNIYNTFEEAKDNVNVVYNSIKNAFDDLYKISEANELKQDCIDYWVGYYWGNCFNDISKYNSLPLLIGYMKKNKFLCNKDECKIVKWLRDNCDKNKTNDLLWLSLLPKCRDCLFEDLKKSVSDLYNDCNKNDHKSLLYLKFIDSLLELNTIKDNDFVKMVKDWLKHNEQRRTLQILAPLYLTLLNKEDSCILSDNSFGQTNNSQFITEFLSVFVLNDSPNAIFKPILWQSSIDNQMFNTIALTMIKDNYSLLKQFLLNKVNDLPNRLLALKMLKNYNKNE